MANYSYIVSEAALRILQDYSTAAAINDAEAGHWPDVLWNTLEESGLTLAWVPDTLGGAGAAVADGFAVLRVAGEYAAPVPLAETLMAGFLLARAGLQVPEGPMTVAPVHALDRLELGEDGLLRGVARDIPFAGWTQHMAVLARRGEADCVLLIATAEVAIEHGQTLAGEPCDRVSFAGVVPLIIAQAEGLGAQALAALGATVRSVQMAGALKRSLDQALLHAMDRVQFGRPIGNFQAIQHNLAQFAGEVAAASAAADAAAEAICAGGLTDTATLTEVATAKIRVGEAASIGSAIAHQVHGAMGFTYEHSLHHATRRLWAWRDEFGNESHWSVLLGGIAARQGADTFWPFVSGVRG